MMPVILSGSGGQGWGAIDLVKRDYGYDKYHYRKHSFAEEGPLIWKLF